MGKKKSLLGVFIIAAVVLATLPFVTTFNEFLTRVVESTKIYRLIERFVVPWESRLIGVILSPLGVDFMATSDGLVINDVFIYLSWNCVGWQGFFLLGISFLGGFQGNFTRLSVFESVLFGFLGTFLVNLFRIAITSILAIYHSQLFALLFHDYFAALVFLAWIFFYWFFVYTFILEEKELNEV